MARLGGSELVESEVAVEHEDFQCAAGDGESLCALAAAGVDAHAYAVGAGFVVDVQGYGGDEEVELVDACFAAGACGTAAGGDD